MNIECLRKIIKICVKETQKKFKENQMKRITLLPLWYTPPCINFPIDDDDDDEDSDNEENDKNFDNNKNFDNWNIR